MTRRAITGNTIVAGVAGRPIHHSLSPELHNAWIEAAGLDAIYAPFSPTVEGFPAFAKGLGGGAFRGLNITLPFKEAALAVAHEADAAAKAAGAANLLLFHADGRLEARNTDGQGLIYAFKSQAPWLDLAKGPVVVLGAGGAARGAVAILEQVGASDIRVVNRTKVKAEALCDSFAAATAWPFDNAALACDGATVVINATSAEIGGEELALDFAPLASGAVVMDMLYRPLKTRFLARAEAHGLPIVDGLDMLIGQAVPSFEALFGCAPPPSLDARALLLAAMRTP